MSELREHNACAHGIAFGESCALCDEEWSEVMDDEDDRRSIEIGESPSYRNAMMDSGRGNQLR